MDWLLHGGFAWQTDPKLEFNLHPVLMITGFVFLYGNAILVFRALPGKKKTTLKILHVMLHTLSLVCVIVGLKSVFDSRNLPAKPISNLYSLHSWLGLLSVILYILQVRLISLRATRKISLMMKNSKSIFSEWCFSSLLGC
ncbi:putative cytochrome b561 isoform X3 [Limulus polyphemus]|uniref:Cytochrome b561 isoform X3 n=1 Tax=Limulus polyphemus TaxID=6850 RepID=A0ABM1ST45_LIMPO|nr:putative cytochrome b561 isoform X3 [Limulus polyphemus]